MAAVLASPRLLAQEAAAEALFDSGRQAMAAGDFPKACQQFRESRRLDPAVGTDFNLADCEEKRGQLATAWQLFRAVEQRLPSSDERQVIARDRARALEGRVPKLTLHLGAAAPRDATIRDGNVALGAASFDVALPMDPGPHELVVSAPGYEPKSFPITLAEAEIRTVEVTPGARASASAGSSGETLPASPASVAGAESKGSGTRTLGFVLGGVGVAGLAVGGVSGLMVLGKKKTVDAHCDDRKVCSQTGTDAASAGHTLQIISNVGWVVGVVGVGVGAYFVLSGPSGSSSPSTTAAITPIPAGAALAVERTW
jgi:hypothetical protein